MLFESASDLGFANAISGLAFCNPFLPERIESEREALGNAFVDSDVVWNVSQDWEGNRPNINLLSERAERVAETSRARLAAGVRASEKELRLYEDLGVYLLYYRVQDVLQQVTKGLIAKPQQQLAGLYDRFVEDANYFLHVPGVKLPVGYETPHLFALYFQIRRAFHHIFRNIVGASMPAARLRASIWQSIFTHDIGRYRRILYDRMNDLTTLITGPSGTGKELVARAVALSRYIPFDPKSRTFAGDFNEMFYPLNLSAMSPTLIESEMFGHRRGAFTGALEDRAGWMEVCSALGTVFLDEIGELDPAIQVKLLRVLQTRQFQRLGDTKSRQFKGKIIAATNRDLAGEMGQGRFRKDFYYRICSDMIVTPSLREQLQESPGDLKGMILFIARRIADEEADGLADEVEAWVHKHLGPEYPWPGNFRELEQCVRNVLIRHEYKPQQVTAGGAGEELGEVLAAGEITAEELLRRYCTLVYSRTRNLEETARRLGLDRRTVKAKVDPEVLKSVKEAG
ncbi:MAG TPA: sigma 54-interacting transcriptional regulator [Tepidisphaeraceae bacterium]|jgi:transcriptional regulator with AAA-type ATPase domain|nr:sigma 54-interacting transcriptional regulator [Tepidisphaeraceae bacterium]